jgi:hypothetical protein
MKGSQSKKIKAIMEGSYASMVGEQTSNRLRGLLIGGIGGLVLGSLFKVRGGEIFRAYEYSRVWFK